MSGNGPMGVMALRLISRWRLVYFWKASSVLPIHCSITSSGEKDYLDIWKLTFCLMCLKSVLSLNAWTFQYGNFIQLCRTGYPWRIVRKLHLKCCMYRTSNCMTVTYTRISSSVSFLPRICGPPFSNRFFRAYSAQQTRVPRSYHSSSGPERIPACRHQYLNPVAPNRVWNRSYCEVV